MIKRGKIATEKRKLERENFPEFFKKHIGIIQTNANKCEECGAELKGDVGEIAHILPKQYYKSISTSDNNVLYLCGTFSNNGCHYKFDNSSNEIFKEMLVYPKISRIFTELEKEITEKINYKTYDRYTD